MSPLAERFSRLLQYILELGADEGGFQGRPCQRVCRRASTGIENADMVSRIADVRDAPAAIRFISFEPLIGAVRDVDLRDIHWAIVGGQSGEGRGVLPQGICFGKRRLFDGTEEGARRGKRGGWRGAGW